MRRLLLTAALAAGVSTSALAQDAQPTPSEPRAVAAASPADITTPEAVVSALYEIISGPAGAPRD